MVSMKMSDSPVNSVSENVSQKGVMSIPLDREENKIINSISSYNVTSDSKTCISSESKSSGTPINSSRDLPPITNLIPGLGYQQPTDPESKEEEVLPSIDYFVELTRRHDDGQVINIEWERGKEKCALMSPEDRQIIAKKIKMMRQLEKPQDIQQRNGIEKETEEKTIKDKLEYDIAHRNISDTIPGVTVINPKNYGEAIGNKITVLNNKTLNFNAKSGLLIFYPVLVAEANMITTTDWIKSSLINKFTQGNIFVKYEGGDIVLVFFKFETRIHRREITDFCLGGNVPTLCSISTENIKAVQAYVSGIKEVVKKKKGPEIPINFNAQQSNSAMKNPFLPEDIWETLVKTLKGGMTNLGSAQFMTAIMKHFGKYKPNIQEKTGYIWIKETLLYKEYSSDEILDLVMKLSTEAIDNEIARLFGENSQCHSEENVQLMSQLGKYKSKTESIVYMKQCKILMDVSDYGSKHFLEMLDNYPTFCATRGGKMLNLETGEVVDRTSDMFFSFEYPVSYVPEQKENKCMDEFINDITLNDFNLKDYLFMKLGYGITGLTEDQKAYFLLGINGSNGKSTLMKFIEHCIGPHFITGVPSLIFKRKGSIPRDLEAPTNGKIFVKNARFVYIPEPHATDELNVSAFKILTGGETDYCKANGGKIVKNKIRYTLFISANRMPSIPDSSLDGALIRRTEIFPFVCKFVKKGDITDPSYQKPLDAGFVNKALKDQNAMDYFFTLLVKGSIRYFSKESKTEEEMKDYTEEEKKKEQERPKRSPKPDCVSVANQEYIEEKDSIQNFLNECCDITLLEGDYELSADLFKSFSKWYRENTGGKQTDETNISFGRILTDKLGEANKCRKKGGLVAYSGIKIRREGVTLVPNSAVMNSPTVNTAHLPPGTIMSIDQAMGLRS